MRYLIIALLFLSVSAFGQKNRYKAPGTAYTTGTPNFVPVRGTEGEVAIDSLTGKWWQYSYQENAWKHLGYWVTETGTSGAPTYTPNKVTSPLAINNGDSLYHYRAGSWRLVSGGAGGSSEGGGIYGPSDTVTYQHNAVVDSGLTFSSAEDTAYLNILMAPGTFGTGAYFNADSIRLRKYDLAGSNEIRLNTSGITLLTTSPDRVTIQGTDSRYAADYRATYNDRSHIDKGYADDTYLQGIDTFSVSNDTLFLSLSRDSVPASFVVLPAGSGSDNQTLSIDSTTVGNIERFAVSISNGNTVRFDVNQDQTVVLNEGYGINNSGTYPNFTIAADTTELATVNDISGFFAQGGNSFGATAVLGTNDENPLNFETNNVERLSVTGGATTGGDFTFTNINSNTNTVQNVFTIRNNTTSTPSTGFGSSVVFQAESSTTDNQNMGSITSKWSNASHSSRTGEFGISLGSAGSLLEVLNLNFSDDAQGSLKIGTSNPVRVNNSGISYGTTFSITGSSLLTINSTSNAVGITSGSDGPGVVDIAATINNTTSTGAIRLNNVSYAQTGGTRNAINIANSFIPTSGNAVHNQMVFSGTMNQTGGANGIVRGIFLNQTITSVADFRALEIAANGTNVKGIYQTGSTAVNNLVGRTRIGSTSAPSRTLDVTGELRVSDLTTDPPTRIVGADADGDFGAITLGSGLSITSGTLNTTGVTLTDGDKGDIDVTSSGTVWTVDTSAITLINMASNSVDSTKIATGAISVTDIGQHGASSGQVLKWNGTQWMPDTDNSTTDTNIYNTDGNVKDGGTVVDVSGNDPIIFNLDASSTETNTMTRYYVDLTGDDLYTHFTQYVTPQDSLYITSFDSGISIDYEGTPASGVGFTISSNTIMNLTADSILVQTLPTRTTLPFVVGLQGNTLSKIEGTADGQVLVWDETNGGFWEIGTSSGGVSDGDKGDIDVTSGGTVWTVDTSAITSLKILDGTVANADLASSVGGIYKGDGTLPAGTTNALLPASGIFRLEYDGANAGLIVDDINSATTIFSKDGTQFFSADNTQSIIGSGTSKMEYIDGVLRMYDSDATHRISIQTPATGSLTANYTLTLPVDDGADNQFLKTDGSGNTSWATIVMPPGTENIESSTFTALKGIINQVDCSAGTITVNPPASPVIGDRFSLTDATASAGTNNITVDFDTANQNLYGAQQNYILNVDGGYVEFIYMGATTGWIATK